jgi:hypothetical protein
MIIVADFLQRCKRFHICFLTTEPLVRSAVVINVAIADDIGRLRGAARRTGTPDAHCNPYGPLLSSPIPGATPRLQLFFQSLLEDFIPQHRISMDLFEFRVFLLQSKRSTEHLLQFCQRFSSSGCYAMRLSMVCAAAGRFLIQFAGRISSSCP